ncbi:MAG TPA: serine/threonine-protein kinase [Thermoanaerobaculia bacterium]|jgi:serine/threonine-protein kinase
MELVGRRFGHIRVVDLVGQGGMGDVYAGFDETLQRRVALKVLHAEQRPDAEARERLLREARALSKLDHPNICRIHDYLETGDVDLLVLEYIEGKTLQEALLAGLTRAEKIRIAAAVASVLVMAHRAGILHRDLKPENVMLTDAGEVKVLDFGLARWLAAATTQRLPAVTTDTADGFGDTIRTAVATAHGVAMGTPLYMSPEQARGETLTPASDMYSFGLLMQVLFTGKEPYPAGVTGREIMLKAARGESLPVSLPRRDRDVAQLITRLKAVAPSDRPTAVDVVARLTHISGKARRFVQRAAVAAVVALITIGTWRYTVDLRQARAEAERRRVQAEDLINFMVGDLRKKLEPVGRLDILDDVSTRALAHISSLDPEQLSVSEILRNSKALSQLGEVRIGQGNLPEALKAFDKSLQLAQIGLARNARDADAQLTVGTSHFWIGNVLRLQGDLPRALGHMERYLGATDGLTKAFPGNSEYQLELAYAHSSVASILELQGELRKALPHHETTHAIKTAHLAAKPGNVEKQADLATTLNKIGFVQQRMGNLRAARAQFEQEFAIWQKVVRASPENAYWKERFANSHAYLASVLEALGETSEAHRVRLQELALDEALRVHDRQNVEWQRDLAIVRMRLGNLLRGEGRAREALQEFRTAESLIEPLIARDQTRTIWQRDLAVVRAYHARALLEAGDAGAAIRMARQAAAVLAPMAKDDPSSARFLAESQLLLGEAHAASGNAAAARAAWTSAKNVLEPVVRKTEDPDFLSVWIRTLVRLDEKKTAERAMQQLSGAGYQAADYLQAIREKES